MADEIFPLEIPQVGQKIRITSGESVIETVVLGRTKTKDYYTIFFPKYDGNPHGRGDNIDCADFMDGGWRIVLGQYVDKKSPPPISVID